MTGINPLESNKTKNNPSLKKPGLESAFSKNTEDGQKVKESQTANDKLDKSLNENNVNQSNLNKKVGSGNMNLSELDSEKLVSDGDTNQKEVRAKPINIDVKDLFNSRALRKIKEAFSFKDDKSALDAMQKLFHEAKKNGDLGKSLSKLYPKVDKGMLTKLARPFAEYQKLVKDQKQRKNLEVKTKPIETENKETKTENKELISTKQKTESILKLLKENKLADAQKQLKELETSLSSMKPAQRAEIEKTLKADMGNIETGLLDEVSKKVKAKFDEIFSEKFSGVFASKKINDSLYQQFKKGNITLDQLKNYGNSDPKLDSSKKIHTILLADLTETNKTKNDPEVQKLIKELKEKLGKDPSQADLIGAMAKDPDKLKDAVGDKGLIVLDERSAVKENTEDILKTIDRVNNYSPEKVRTLIQGIKEKFAAIEQIRRKQLSNEERKIDDKRIEEKRYQKQQSSEKSEDKAQKTKETALKEEVAKTTKNNTAVSELASKLGIPASVLLAYGSASFASLLNGGLIDYSFLKYLGVMDSELKDNPKFRDEIIQNIKLGRSDIHLDDTTVAKYPELSRFFSKNGSSYMLDGEKLSEINSLDEKTMSALGRTLINSNSISKTLLEKINDLITKENSKKKDLSDPQKNLEWVSSLKTSFKSSSPVKLKI